MRHGQVFVKRLRTEFVALRRMSGQQKEFRCLSLCCVLVSPLINGIEMSCNIVLFKCLEILEVAFESVAE